MRLPTEKSRFRTDDPYRTGCRKARTDLALPVLVRLLQVSTRWPRMFRPNGKQIEKLRNALLAAFPSESRLREFATFELDKNLNEIEGNDLSTKSLNLILWALSTGRLRELVVQAHDRVPGNDELGSVANELLPFLRTASPLGPSAPLLMRTVEALSSETVSRGLFA